MTALLGITLAKAVLPPIVQLRTPLAAIHPEGWLGQEELAVRLADLGPVDPQLREQLIFAVDKAAAAHQGFEIELSGLEFSGRFGRPREAYIVTSQNAGMLQALTFSTLRKLPPQVQPRIAHPWRPKLLLARFPSPPSAAKQLALRVAVAGNTWRMTVRELAWLANGGGALKVEHTAKLPG